MQGDAASGEPFRPADIRRYPAFLLLLWVPALLFTACAPYENPSIRKLNGWQYHYGESPPAPGENRNPKTSAKNNTKANAGKITKIRWRETTSLLNPVGREKSNVLILRVPLPRDIAGASLFIPYSFTSMQSGFRERMPEQKPRFAGKAWRILDLTPADANRYFYVRVHSDYHYIGITGNVLLGRRADLILHLLRGDLDRFALSILYVFLGLVCLYLFVRRPALREFLASSMFLLGVGFYTAFYMRSPQLFIPSTPMLSVGWLVSLFVMPFSISLFMEKLFGSGPLNILRWVRLAILVYGITALGLAVADVVHPLKIRFPLFALMLCAIVAALIVLAGAIRRGDMNARIMLVGFGVLTAAVILDVNLALFASKSAQRPRPISHLGMFAFSLALLYILGRRFAETYRDLARRSRELEKARDQLAGHAGKLEQTVRESTEELRETNSELEASNENLRESNRRLEEAREVAQADMRLAMHVQSSVLVTEAPDLTDWDVAFHFQPVSGVSGDFYEFFTRENKLLGVGLFDVSGHGTASGLITVLARNIIHRHFFALEHAPLGEIMIAVNEELLRELERVENFLTGVLVRTTPHGVDCVLAGHTRPVIKRRTGEVETIGGGEDDPRGSILGSRFARSEYRAMSRKLAPGDTLLLYTDALIESANESEQPFQTKHLLHALTELSPELSAGALIGALRDELLTHVGNAPLTDDLTIIALKKTMN